MRAIVFQLAGIIQFPASFSVGIFVHASGRIFLTDAFHGKEKLMDDMLLVHDGGHDFIFWPDKLTGFYVCISATNDNSAFAAVIYDADGEKLPVNPSFGPTAIAARDLAIAKINKVAATIEITRNFV